MIRIYRAPLKNSVRQWRAAGTHPASGDTVLRPELIAGPYVLLTDAAAQRRQESFC
jgi:hypothetical protein